MPDEIRDLRDNAERCRTLAEVVSDERNLRLLLEMAEKLGEMADKLEREASGRIDEAGPL